MTHEELVAKVEAMGARLAQLEERHRALAEAVGAVEEAPQDPVTTFFRGCRARADQRARERRGRA